jgi:hypothetical protein
LFAYEVLASYGLAALLTGWLLLRSNRAINRAIGVFALWSVVTVPVAMVEFAHAPEGTLVMPGYLTLADWLDRAVPVPFFPPWSPSATRYCCSSCWVTVRAEPGCSTTRRDTARY